MKNNKSQKGFAILELIIAIGLSALLMSIVAIFISNFIDRSQTQKNEFYVKDMSSTLNSYYQSFAFDIENNKGSSYMVSSENINIKSGNLTNEVIPMLDKISKSTSSQNIRYVDGYNRPMMILISNRLEKEYQGVLIPYRVIAVISNNDGDYINGKPEFKTRMNIQTGEMDISNEELVSVFNTYSTQVDKFIQSKKNVDVVASAYSQFYWSRHNMTIGNPSIDYFASGNGNWDKGTLIRRSCEFNNRNISGFNTPGVDSRSLGLSEELNIGISNYMDSWGQPLYVMNCGSINNIRIGNKNVTLSPNNPDNGGSQPYNAIVGFTMGNGQTYIKTIIAKM